jgi:hypothetical protein
MDDFTFRTDADLTGAHQKCTMVVAPAKLVAEFGESTTGDAYKISMEYAFTNEAGSVVRIHDWKATSLYCSHLPDPSEFRRSTEPYEFFIGSHEIDVAMRFRDWLERILK